MFCPDCGAKLHFCAAKSLRRDQEFFRCANYKEGRGKCRIHYIRDIVLQKIVTEAVSDLSDFVRCYEPVFLYMLEQKEIVSRKQEQQAAEANLETWRRRSREIDRIISRLYEDNTAGKITDERFSRLMLGYETEQRDLEKKIAENEEKLCELVKAAVDLRALLEGFRKFTELKELTPEIVNTLIKRIEVHNSDRYDGHCHVKVDIYFTAVGMIDRPSEEEIREMIVQMQKGNSLVKETA